MDTYNVVRFGELCLVLACKGGNYQSQPVCGENPGKTAETQNPAHLSPLNSPLIQQCLAGNPLQCEPAHTVHCSTFPFYL